VDSLQSGLNAVYLLLQWRVLVCLAASMAVAAALSQTSWATVPQLIVLALAGGFPGLVWQARAEAGAAPVQGPTATSPGVQHAAGVMLGAVWGAASAASWPSVVLGAIVLAIGGAVWRYHAAAVRSWVSAAAAWKVLRSVASAYGVCAIALQFV
jgi:hypothetical protein